MLKTRLMERMFCVPGLASQKFQLAILCCNDLPQPLIASN